MFFFSFFFLKLKTASPNKQGHKRKRGEKAGKAEAGRPSKKVKGLDVLEKLTKESLETADRERREKIYNFEVAFFVFEPFFFLAQVLTGNTCVVCHNLFFFFVVCKLLVLFAQKPEGLRRLLQSVKTHSESSGLYLKAKKTKIMDLDKSPTTTIDVDGEQLTNVNNFVYLGSRIEADGKSSRHSTLDCHRYF